MSEQEQAIATISTQQIVQSAAAGVEFFNLDTTLIPGNMRKQVAVLEAVLQGVATGNLRVVSPQQNAVESGADDDISDLTGSEDDAKAEEETAA